jgi:hypothetical protein
MKTCLGQRSDGSTYSSPSHLDESGELHVSDSFTPGFVTVVSHWKGKTAGQDAEKFLLLSGIESETSGRSLVV